VAKYLKLTDSGVVKAGTKADLILLNGNPLADISNTKKIEGVVLNGKWLSKSERDAGLKKLEK
jgi:imidazolonepropionase-like amidohydrolase